jgi:hypothetical protein
MTDDPNLSGVADEPDPRKKLAFDESVRALEQQSSALDNLRGRTGVLLTAISLTATFLGAQALERAGFSFLSWVAIGCFVVAGLACLAILWPSGEWKFVLNAKTICTPRSASTLVPSEPTQPQLRQAGVHWVRSSPFIGQNSIKHSTNVCSQ